MTKKISNTVTIAFTATIILMVVVYLFVTKITSSNTSRTAVNHRLQIVTSFYPLFFFTSQIAQDNAEIHNITPAGAEPHDYEPTPRDMAKIENSDLLIINGAKFEGWADNVKPILDGKGTPILNIQENLLKHNIIENSEQLQDPHYWLDPVLAKEEVKFITDRLILIDPIKADYYYNNSKILLDKLEVLNIKLRTELNYCQKRDIVTSHAAFGHLASEYGLSQISISGLSPDEEPSTKKLIEVSNFAKNNNVNYIFFESLVSPKLADTIAQEIGAKTLVLNPIEGLTDNEIAHGKNYFTVMQDNLTNLKLALQCP